MTEIQNSKLKIWWRHITVFILIFVSVFSGWPWEVKQAQAAISFVGSAENSTQGTGNISVDLTTITGLAENDLVIVAYGVGDNDNTDFDITITTSGYTEVADLFSDDTFETNLGVFWKVMGATPDTTVTASSLGGNDASNVMVVMVFRGVDTTTPMDVTPTTDDANVDTMHPNPPSLDHGNPSGVWTAIVGASGHDLGDTGTYTFPTGYTTNANDRGHNDTSDLTVGFGYNTSPSDPEDPGTMTHSGTDDTAYSWAAVTMALRPEAVTAADLTWDTGAADFEIWAGATAETDASLAWDNGTLICSAYLNDDNDFLDTCGAINTNQTYRVQAVLKNVGGANASMASGDFVDQVNAQTYWAGTSASLVDCGFNDTDTDNTSASCSITYNNTNDARITQTGTEVLIAATTGSEGFMYRITTGNDVSLSDSSTFMNASIDSVTEDSSKITIGQDRTPGNYIRALIKIRGLIKFR